MSCIVFHPLSPLIYLKTACEWSLPFWFDPPILVDVSSAVVQNAPSLMSSDPGEVIKRAKEQAAAAAVDSSGVQSSVTEESQGQEAVAGQLSSGDVEGEEDAEEAEEERLRKERQAMEAAKPQKRRGVRHLCLIVLSCCLVVLGWFCCHFMALSGSLCVYYSESFHHHLCRECRESNPPVKRNVCFFLRVCVFLCVFVFVYVCVCACVRACVCVYT